MPDSLAAIATATGCAAGWLLTGDADYRQEDGPALVVRSGQSRSMLLPTDLADDERLTRAIDQLIDVLRASPHEDVDTLLGNIRVFAREAHRRLGEASSIEPEARAHGEPRKKAG